MASKNLVPVAGKAIKKLGLKSLVIFCAIIINGLFTELIAFIIDDDSWISKLLYALVLHCLSAAAFLVFKLRRGSGTFTLEILSEMTAWAWVGVIGLLSLYTL